MTWGIVNIQAGSDLFFVCIEDHVLGFDTKHQAEDFADDMDEPGEWEAHVIPEGIGVPVVMVT